ncbi:MAG: hypothetical protein OEZ68_07530 [Gammaproteobacteria bacterium]|nr:hypothetical protein [Gammaproteobacteria bacterium]MDH5800635.1 hypothetical protein [Gammaproteobacteria bacterium]
MKTLPALAILAAISGNVSAENYFINLSAGSTSVEIGEDSSKHSITSSEISFGQYVRPDIAVEISYTELGTTSTTITNADSSSTKLAYDNSASKVVLSKYFDLNETYKLSAHGGGIIIVQNTTTKKYDTTGSLTSTVEDSSRSNKIYLGLGLSYKYQNSLITLRHERYKSDLQDFETTLLGVQFNL